MIATSTCACTVVVHIFFRGTGKIPYIIRKIFLEFLAKLFCMVPSVALPAPQTTIAKKEIQVPLLHSQQQQKSAFTAYATMPASSIENGNLPHQINRLNDMENSQAFKHDEISPIKNSQISNDNKQITKSCTHLNQISSMSNTNVLPTIDQTSNNVMHHSQNLIQKQYSLSYHNHQNVQHQQQQQQLSNELNLTLNLIENDIKEIRDYLRHTRKKLETSDAKSKQTNEWKQVALVLDRALFFCYCIAIVVSLALMFPR